ncbi:MAG TPA: MBL fold metallo-hydrolase [Bryobacteraceae bacterium]|jgi:glyoxylase-like metal-dependent hydrolase (beta-lactamase superfamily II)
MHIRAHSPRHHASRRDFFQILAGSTLSGASILELAFHRAAWSRALGPGSDSQLFDIEKVAEGVYLAKARPQALINSNAAIFVNSADVLVVDSHSKPSAAASLIAQIKREITPKPVRYLVNSHFHWDHTQGNRAYRTAENKIDFIASKPTKQLMAELARKRLDESLAGVPQQIDALRTRAEKASSEAEKTFCQDQIRQLRAYQAELRNYTLELPTITFDTSYLIRDKAHDLHVEFHGRAHTAGDVVVFCPQKRAVATGDMILGFLPYIGDGFPRTWPKTIDSVAKLSIDHVLPGHGPVQSGRQTMTNERNYIEELTSKVAAGKDAGKSVADLQKTITMASLKSLQSNGYANYVTANYSSLLPEFEPAAGLENSVKTNIAEIYKNLDRT